MKVAIIGECRELIDLLKLYSIDVIPKSFIYPDALRKQFGEKIKVIFITRNILGIMVKKFFDAYYNNDIFSTLIIKYDKIYFQNKQIIDALNSFLNISIIQDIQDIQDTSTLQNKIDITFRVSATYLINKIVLLNEKNSDNTKRHYRFGDVIFHKGYYWKESTQFILEQDHLKDSILRTYIERCPDNNLKSVHPQYIQLLKTIINGKINSGNYELPAVTELVIHLRLGDVVDHTWFLQKDYVSLIKTYRDKHNITKVTFCTAFHYGNNVTQGTYIYSDEKHNKNIRKLKELFSSILTNIDLFIDVRSSADIDSDLIYMTQAKYFIKDEGGFSDLIKQFISADVLP